jgi:hypothetical protein
MSYDSKKKKGNKNLNGESYMKLALGNSRSISEKLYKFDPSSKFSLSFIRLSSLQT